jgi:glycosyltransferase involved in cell wall biosynthesis
MISIVISVIIVVYILLILIFWLGWEKALPCLLADNNELNVSIVVAVRNEEDNITDLINNIIKQKYSTELLELIIIDDHSDDKTVEIVKELANSSSLYIRLESLDEGSGKKDAMSRGIELASNEYILTTDGDCRVSQDWVASMVRCFSNPEIQFVSGPVKLHPQDTIFQRLQAIEFSSLVASGAATLSLGWPTMANAANMAFRKDAYNAAKINAKDVASGDDVFLLHSIGRHYKRGYTFCRDENAIVRTGSSSGLNSFFQQRKRWSGKWQHYNDIPTKLLAVFIFLVNISILSVPILVIWDYISWELAINLFMVKLFFEFWFLREVQKFFKNMFLLHEFITLAIIYPVYVTIIAIAGLIGNYQWKGRSTR